MPLPASLPLGEFFNFFTSRNENYLTSVLPQERKLTNHTRTTMK